MTDPYISAARSYAAKSRWSRPGERQRASETAKRALRERFAKDLPDDLDPGEREVLIDAAVDRHASMMRMHRAKARGDAA